MKCSPTNSKPEHLSVRDALSADYVRSRLTLQSDGMFVWRTSPHKVHVGKIAGGRNKGTGYWYIKIDGLGYVAHRLVWLYVHGRWPERQLDHINGIRTDNRLSNLREAETFENQQNAIPRPNVLGYIGVVEDKSKQCRMSKPYRAMIRVGGKRLYLGHYATPKEAHEAYVKAKAIHHPFQPTIRATEAA